MHPVPVLLCALALSACGGPGDAPAPELPNTSDSTAVAEPIALRIWPTVDSTDAFHAEAIACLRRYLEQKHGSGPLEDYWYTPDVERFGPIYPEVLYAEYDSVGDVRYQPTLLAIRATGNTDQRLLTVRWAAADERGNPTRVRYVFDFLARTTEHGIRLGFPIAHNTREWFRTTVGPIQYICSPEHRFSAAEADEQRADLQRLSAFFGIPEFPITYYSCANPSDLFRAKGFH